MKIKEYVVVNDKELHPRLKVKHTYQFDWDSLKTYEEIVHMMIDCFDMNELAEEYMYVLAFNTEMDFLGIFNVAHGTSREVWVGRRETCIFALLIGAEKIILIHNHPGRKAKASNDDLNLTNSFVDLCDELQIDLKEHIIISRSAYHLIYEEKTFDIEE